MRIVVFGASGNCGGHFVRLAWSRGHAVTAVVRSTAAYDPRPGVRVETGDVLDRTFVHSAVAGHDAVFSGLGMRYRHPWAKRLSPDDFISRSTENIVSAMQASGVRRIGVISAGGIGDSRPMLNLVMRFLVAFSNVGVAYADLEHVESILRVSGLDWQAVRPTTLTHRPATGKARITNRYPATASIPRADVAAFMLAELERRTFSATTPMITVT
jgi:putative NADH-flavin reductase